MSDVPDGSQNPAGSSSAGANQPNGGTEPGTSAASAQGAAGDGDTAGSPPAGRAPNQSAPSWVLCLAALWVLVLAGAFVLYLVSEPVRHALPQSIGKLPVTVPWFGAIGGCLISLIGITDFGVVGWNRKFNYWHPLWPLLGAIMGSIGCLLLLLTTDLSTKGTLRTDAAFYDGVAFVLGYAEGSFRQLITNVTNVIIAPGSTGTTGSHDAAR